MAWLAIGHLSGAAPLGAGFVTGRQREPVASGGSESELLRGVARRARTTKLLLDLSLEIGCIGQNLNRS